MKENTKPKINLVILLIITVIFLLFPKQTQAQESEEVCFDIKHNSTHIEKIEDLNAGDFVNLQVNEVDADCMVNVVGAGETEPYLLLERLVIS